MIADRWRAAPGNWRAFRGQWLTRMLYGNALIALTLVHALVWPITPLYELIRDRANARSAAFLEPVFADRVAQASAEQRRSLSNLVTLRLYCHPGHPVYTRMAATLAAHDQEGHCHG